MANPPQPPVSPLRKDPNSVGATWFPMNITTQTTTLLKTGPGTLHTLDYTATASGTITIYDGISAGGTKLRTITTPATLLQSEVNKVLDLEFIVGLTIVTATASQDIVVAFS